MELPVAKILLINPSWLPTYNNTIGVLTAQFYPSLTLAMVAANVRSKGHKVEILDYSYRKLDICNVLSIIKKEGYDIVGFTSTTPLFPQIILLSREIKKISKSIFTIAGGPHCSALPEESICEADLDAVCAGEGEYLLAQIADGENLDKIAGLTYKQKDGKIRVNENRPWLQNLDDLPMPAWDLFNLNDYKLLASPLVSKNPPVGFLETTRGCVYKCDFCANIPNYGRLLRKKSIDRVIEEVKYLKSFGFNEFALTDNIFTTDVERTKEICRRIINEKVKISWQCHNGIRVDTGDEEMFKLMKKAGCYRVAFGFESGNDEILRKFGKGGKASMEQAFNIVRMVRKAGIEILGYFMLGLLDDTEETMIETIEFGRKLDLDLVKIGYCIPFPGTSMYNTLKQKRLLKSKSWESYNVYKLVDLFIHPNVKSDVLEKYYKLAYRRMIYTNPRFILRRFKRALVEGKIIQEAYYFTKFVIAKGRL